MRIAYLFTMLLPTMSLAQTPALPELYSVTGIKAGDVVNIRQEPNTTAAIIGTLAPEARDIEVMALSQNGEWAWVNKGDNGGWVSYDLLQMQPNVWQIGALPPSLSCMGTEPFWSLSFADGKASIQTPDSPEQSYNIESISDRNFPEDRIRVVRAGDLTAVISAQQCSDGMSDRLYGLQAILALQGAEQPVLAGCCSIMGR